MEKTNRCIMLTFAGLMLGTLSVLPAADPPQSATNRDAQSNQQQKTAPPPKLLIIGASSLNSPVGQTQLLEAMLESQKIHMHIEGAYPDLDALKEILGKQKAWDYVIMDAWHLGRASADGSEGNASVPPDFPHALADFVKQVRAHSPECKIILFPWWVPRGPTATNEGVRAVFRRCVEQAKVNKIWVSTTGPAYMEALLERPDLRIKKSETDAHPGIHGAYLNACSLFTIVADKSPVGLPAKLMLRENGDKKVDYTLEADDAKYLQELAWKVYQREIKSTRPAK